MKGRERMMQWDNPVGKKCHEYKHFKGFNKDVDFIKSWQLVKAEVEFSGGTLNVSH